MDAISLIESSFSLSVQNWQEIGKNIIIFQDCPNLKNSNSRTKKLFININDTLTQRGNRLRESLPTFITLHKARAVYHWEVVADTKLFQDSSLGNSVCTSRCRTK